MNNNVSIFTYKILNSRMAKTEIEKYINEELNRNLTFYLTEDEEKIVPIKGKWMDWARAEVEGDNLYIYVKDGFFSKCSIIKQIIISLWSNLEDFAELRLERLKLSKKMENNLKLDLRNQGLRELIKKEGPYTGTIIKPSYGLSLSQKIEIAKRFADAGGTFLKEDETYLVEKNKILFEAQKIQDALKSVSRRAFYVPNITAYIHDRAFLEELYDCGIRIVMINFLITGLPKVNHYVDERRKLFYWGHRIGYKVIERYISMQALTTLAVYSGISLIHIGTPFLSSEEEIKEKKVLLNALRDINPEVIPVFTKVSHHIAPKLIREFGKQIILMACGAIRTDGQIDWEKLRKIKEGI